MGRVLGRVWFSVSTQTLAVIRGKSHCSGAVISAPPRMATCLHLTAKLLCLAPREGSPKNTQEKLALLGLRERVKVRSRMAVAPCSSGTTDSILKRRLGHREVKSLAQGQTANESWRLIKPRQPSS